jgi:hypothetical protein
MLIVKENMYLIKAMSILHAAPSFFEKVEYDEYGVWNKKQYHRNYTDHLPMFIPKTDSSFQYSLIK